MKKREYQATLGVKLLGAAILLLMARPLWAQASKPEPFTDYSGYVAWMQKNHKAPFKGVATTKSGVNALLDTQSKVRSFDAANETGSRNFFQNVKVNQDRNPWPKAGIASAVDPSDPKTWVVMSNDFRDNATRIFYHVSTDRGKNWTDDAMAGGADPFIGGVPLTFQVNPALSFDDAGNSHLSALSGNQILDFNNNYLNLDSEIDEVRGFSHGTYSDALPTLIDAQSCSGTLSG